MKTILSILFIFIGLASFGQNYLQKNDTIIKLSGIDLINNNIRFDLITKKDTNGVIKYIPELWLIEDEKIKVFDVGKRRWNVTNDAIIELINPIYFKNYTIKK